MCALGVKKVKINSCQYCIFWTTQVKVFRVIMQGKKDQRNRELKRAVQSCSKLTDIFKRLKPSEESKELSASENQDIATSNLEREG